MIQKPKLVGLVAIVLLATAGTGAVVALSKKTETAQTTSTTTPTSTTDTAATTQPTSNDSMASSDTSTSSSATYKDGTYSATGSYITPDGGEDIGVTVTLANDIITNVSLSGLSTRGDSSEYQARFASGYKQLVVGKAIASISLSRVSGSSLTSTGFNSALATIKSQAKA